MAFKAAKTLILLGLTLLAVGGFWMLFEQGVITDITADYWVDNVYLDVMQIEWNAIPLIVFFLGLFLAVIGAMGSKQEAYY